MAARSTGLYPREGFSLDAQMQVPENAGGTVAVLGDLSKAKTFRVIIINPIITGDAKIELYLEQAGGVVRTYDVNTAYAPGSGTLIIDHIRGASIKGTQDVAYQLVQGTGSVTLDGVYIELVDRPAR